MQDKIVQQVVQKFQQRSDVGIKKYGTTLESNNRDNYLLHLQQELMDAVLYIEKEMSLMKEITSMVKFYSNDDELGEKIREFVR